MQEAF